MNKKTLALFVLFFPLICAVSATAAPLHEAASRGDLAEVQRLIEHEHVPVDLVDSDAGGETALEIAISNGHIEIVRYLNAYLIAQNAQSSAREAITAPVTPYSPNSPSSPDHVGTINPALTFNQDEIAPRLRSFHINRIDNDVYWAQIGANITAYFEQLQQRNRVNLYEDRRGLSPRIRHYDADYFQQLRELAAEQDRTTLTTTHAAANTAAALVPREDREVPQGTTDLEIIVKDRHSRAENPSRASHWVDHVVLQRKQIGILESDIPKTEITHYQIKSEQLVKSCQNQHANCCLTVGTVLSETQLFEHPAITDAVSSITDDLDLDVEQSQEFNPAYHALSLTPEQNQALQNLREKVQLRVQALNQTHLGFYYCTGALEDGTLWVNPSGYDNNPMDSQEFNELMDSLENKNEAQFIERLVNLASHFNLEHSEAKNGFLDGFTHLFVTDFFPSEGMRQCYFHYLLRCGHLH